MLISSNFQLLGNAIIERHGVGVLFVRNLACLVLR